MVKGQSKKISAAREEEGRQAEAALDFWRDLPFPAYLLNREHSLYLANQALADAFGYPDIAAAEAAMRAGDFLPRHFNPGLVDAFYELLLRDGRVENWLMPGETLDGRRMTLEISAWGRFSDVRGPQSRLKAVFIPPGEVRASQALLAKARLSVEQAEKAKNEFLANISHELRTPLNVIIGMLSLALEDNGAPAGETRENLALANEAADRLFTILNDLIFLSDLEGGSLVSDLAKFSPAMLLETLTRHFSAQAREKGVALIAETDDTRDAVLEGGYNFIVMAMEKLVNNAIKFTDEGGQGEALLRARVERKEDGLWLACAVADNGPGLARDILETQELFRQGDGSMIRKHGGLGLGLRLTKNLVASLGGQLNLANREEGGAVFSFNVPVKIASND